MDIAGLRNQAYALSRSMEEKREGISMASDQIAGMEEALAHARAARAGADDLARSISYFAPVEWRGNHADSFFRTMGADSRGHQRARELHERCEELVRQMESRLSGLEQRKRALEREIVRDQRAYDQTMRQIRKAV